MQREVAAVGCCSGGQLIWLGGHFEKAALIGGPYLPSIAVSLNLFRFVTPFVILHTLIVTPSYSVFNTGTYDIIAIMITAKCCSGKLEQTTTTFFTTKIDRMANFEIRG